jgi:hypothetical protein
MEQTHSQKRKSTYTSKIQRLHVGILKMSIASESIGDYHNPVKEMEDLGALRKETKWVRVLDY